MARNLLTQLQKLLDLRVRFLMSQNGINWHQKSCLTLTFTLTHHTWLQRISTCIIFLRCEAYCTCCVILVALTLKPLLAAYYFLSPCPRDFMGPASLIMIIILHSVCVVGTDLHVDYPLGILQNKSKRCLPP